MAENKVKFGLKNVHYALLTEGSTNAWSTPVAIPGAVSLSLEPNGESSDFYADNVTYFRSFANNGYNGTLEMARLSDAFVQAVYGQDLDNTSKVLFEYNNVDPKPFALLFQIDGDQNDELYCFYRCIPGRPTIASETIGENKEPQTAEIEISCLPLVTGTTNQLNLIKACTTKETDSTTRTTWFTSVPVPN